MSYTSDRTGAEIDTTLDNADSHIANTSNPHSVGPHQLTASLETLVEESGVNVLDFDTAFHKTITLTGAALFTTLNRAPGKSLQLRIVGDDTSGVVLTFPAGWVFMNSGGRPTAMTFPSEAILSLTCYGVDDADIRAVYLEES